MRSAVFLSPLHRAEVGAKEKLPASTFQAEGMRGAAFGGQIQRGKMT